MIVKCWNCGNDIEKRGAEEYRADLLKNVKKLQQIFYTAGDIYRVNAYDDIIYMIENFDD